MTIKELLALCRDEGYEGPADRASLKAWLDDPNTGVEFKDTKTKKSLTIEDLWPEMRTKGITLTVSKNGDAPDTVNVVEDTGGGDMPAPEGSAAEPPAPKTRTHDPEATKANGIKGMLADGKAFTVGRPEVLAYKHRIRNRYRGGYKDVKDMIAKRAVFDDVDRAEYLGAACRLKYAPTVGRLDYAQKARDMEIVGKGATGSVNAQGGATFMGEFVPELIVLLNEYGATRQLLNVRRPTGAPPYTYPRRTADPTVSWAAAGAAASDQNPAYDNVEVNIGKLIGYMNVDNELLNDSAISIVDDLMGGFANAISYQEDLAFFLGDGTSTYNGVTGLINAIGSAGIATQGTSNTWGTMVDGDIQAMLGKLPSYAWRGAPKMTCTPAAFFNIINRLSRGIGGVTYTESQTGIVKPVYNGYEVVYNDVMASATAVSTISVIFGAFDYAAKAVEIPGSLEFATSEHYRFANDQLALRTRERFGINVHDAGDTSTAGPVVALKTGA